jgi:hypothetical protein
MNHSKRAIAGHRSAVGENAGTAQKIGGNSWVQGYQKLLVFARCVLEEVRPTLTSQNEPRAGWVAALGPGDQDWENPLKEKPRETGINKKEPLFTGCSQSN